MCAGCFRGVVTRCVFGLSGQTSSSAALRPSAVCFCRDLTPDNECVVLHSCVCVFVSEVWLNENNLSPLRRAGSYTTASVVLSVRLRSRRIM